MTLLRDMTDFVCTADATRLPDLDRAILRRHVSDTVVARLVGGRSQEGRELSAIFAPQAGLGSIAGLAALVRLTEMDDIHVASTTTPSSVAVPVALALVCAEACPPARVESAVYVGVETLVRFGKAIDGSRSILKGFWPTRTAATMAAAATAAHLWAMDPASTQEALSLAATMTHSRTGRFLREPSGRWIVFAAAVENGLRAAEAARHGFNGGPVAPSADWLSDSLGTTFDPRAMLEGLGQGSVLPELSLKPYGTARQCLSAAEAMRSLLEQGLDPSNVQHVSIRVPTAHIPMIGQALDPDIRATSFVSVAAQVATAALRPNDLYDVQRSGVLQDPAVAAFAQRCSIVGDAELDALFPAVWGARLDVTSVGGQQVSQTVLHPQGSPEHRMDDGALRRKAHGLLTHVGLQGRTEAVLDLGLRGLEDGAALAELGRLFVHG